MAAAAPRPRSVPLFAGAGQLDGAFACEQFLTAALPAPVRRRNRQPAAPAHLQYGRDIPEVSASPGKITPRFYSGGPHEP
jgi:hypothetical protein